MRLQRLVHGAPLTLEELLASHEAAVAEASARLHDVRWRAAGRTAAQHHWVGVQSCLQRRLQPPP